MNTVKKHVALNKRLAQSLWGPLNKPAVTALKELLKSFRFAISQGDVQYFGKGWYVTHVGLIRLAQRRHCAGIRV